MSEANYFLPSAADEWDLSPWAPILPAAPHVLRTNLFGDAFIRDASNAIFLLDRGACSAEQIASSEAEFWREIGDDSHGWQLRPLADQCRERGLSVGDGQCYAFKMLPVLGGEYNVDNVWVAHWAEWFDLTADVFDQIKDVPDGTPISINFDRQR